MSLVTVNDLAIAYRKVKVDLFYSGNPHRIDLLEFEEDLENNLNIIKDAYERNDISFFLDVSNGFWYYPKRIELLSPKSSKRLIDSDPNKNNISDIIQRYEVRIIERLPIAFHVITTLWINAVGQKLESKLSENAYGNRIKRDENGNVNIYSLGTFSFYKTKYRQWRNKALESIRNALDNQKKVIAFTTDFTAFYHSINPCFILESVFLSKLDVCLNDEEKEFSCLIVKMLIHWAKKTPLKRGLPVGCSVSSVIANLALVFFDKYIEERIHPLYYGRYVDDIIFVVENADNLSKQEEIWNWLQKEIILLSEQISDLKGVAMSQYNSIAKHQKKHCVNEKSLYLDYSKVYKEFDQTIFGNLVLKEEKTKMFVLDKSTGTTFLDLLEKQMKEMSSEWRLLPELPEDRYIPSMLLSASTKNGEESDTLRATDSISMRRAMFSIKLNDFEAYCRDLEPTSWKKQRHAFLKTILLYFTNPDTFFEYFRFFPRILSIAVECEDYRLVHQIISAVFKKSKILKVKNCYISGQKNIKRLTTNQFKIFLEYISSLFFESLISSISTVEKKQIKSINNIIQRQTLFNTQCKRDIGSLYNNLFAYDLANKEFCLLFNPYYKSSQLLRHPRLCTSYFYSNIDKESSSLRFVFLNLLLIHPKRLFCIWPVPRKKIPKAFLFPTRPFHSQDLYVITKKPIQNAKTLSNILFFLRGYSNETVPVNYTKDLKLNIEKIDVKNKSLSPFISIALASWKTDEASLQTSIKGKWSLDSNRYSRLSHLINHILKCNHKVDYVVFPELSIPPLWFLSIAQKLQNLGISLIGGVEYIPRTPDAVSNQVWCSLLHKQSSFSQSVIVIHDKGAPAIHEREELDKHSIKFFCTKESRRKPIIIKHEDFCFGVLICSELTNIDYRAFFRGKIDALFVPEWNSDTTLFGSLVEAAANDVHAYIIQCNNREYGDTRIRVPAKNDYNRDLVRIKGGEEDYYVVGEIDINGLRRFQRGEKSSNNKALSFKPVPSGFKIADYRIIIPENQK